MLQLKSNKYYTLWVCVCRLSYPACHLHAPYCILWPSRLYSIFLHHLINGTTVDKKLLNIKYLFWFSVQSLSETFRILRTAESDKIKNLYWSSCIVAVKLVRFSWNLDFLDRFSWNLDFLDRFSWNLDFLDRFSINTQISNIMKICPIIAEFFCEDRRMAGRKGGQTYMMKPTAAIRNFANAPK